MIRKIELLLRDDEVVNIGYSGGRFSLHTSKQDLLYLEAKTIERCLAIQKANEELDERQKEVNEKEMYTEIFCSKCEGRLVSLTGIACKPVCPHCGSRLHVGKADPELLDSIKKDILLQRKKKEEDK